MNDDDFNIPKSTQILYDGLRVTLSSAIRLYTKTQEKVWDCESEERQEWRMSASAVCRIIQLLDTSLELMDTSVLDLE